MITFFFILMKFFEIFLKIVLVFENGYISMHIFYFNNLRKINVLKYFQYVYMYIKITHTCIHLKSELWSLNSLSYWNTYITTFEFYFNQNKEIEAYIVKNFSFMASSQNVGLLWHEWHLLLHYFVSFILQQEINSFKRMKFIFYMQGYLKTIVTYSLLNFIEVLYTDESDMFDSFSVKSHDGCHFSRGLLRFV